MQRLTILACGLAGAAGVALMAFGAHGTGGRALSDGGVLLLIHAAAGIGLVALARHTGAAIWLVVAAVLLSGAGLFAADIAARAYLKTRLFAFAAPTGGMAMLAGWLVLAVLALWRR